jgi:alkylation response protein AidB-like acyl-CoA dehydrogenase
MFDLRLTSEQIEFRDMVRSFATNEVRPAALKPDRLEPFAKPLLVDLLNETSALGLRTLTLSEDNGGVGANSMSSCIVLEELASGDVDIAAVMGRTELLARELFDLHMTDGQRAQFLEAFHGDEKFHLAYTGNDPEKDLGWSYHGDAVSDAPGLPTATLEGDDYVIDGSVEHVANAPIAGLLVVEVKSAKGSGTSAVLVPRDTSGLTISEPLDAVKGSHIRWHHGTAAKVDFKSCRVPKANLLGLEGQNPFTTSGYFNKDTLQRAAINLGLGQVAFETAIEYAGIRRQGARNIIEHGNIGDKIADMAVKLELARTMIWKAAWTADNPDAVGQGSVSDLPLDLVASTFTAESVQEITVLAAEFFGAMGIMRDMPLQKFVNDGNIFANSADHDIATKLRIAESVIGYVRARAA